MTKATSKIKRRVKSKTLVMFSGGIDSTAALWHVLNNPDQYGEILVHHIHIQNIEARWRAEALAVKDIIEYMHQNSKTPFTYTESSINTPHLGGHFLFDTEVISFLTGYMTSRDSSITKVVIGATGTDFKMGAPEAVRRGKAVHNAFHLKEEDHSASIKEYPHANLSKEEVYKTLPKELAVLTWSCRRPHYADGKPIECGRCKTCVIEMKGLDRPKTSGRKIIK